VSKHRRLSSVLPPEPATQREGFIDERGFHPHSGFMFVLDDEEQRQYFLHAKESDRQLFWKLRPGDRVAFDVAVDPDNRRPRAQRVRLLA
jgi:cold shock CspA family protein